MKREKKREKNEVNMKTCASSLLLSLLCVACESEDAFVFFLFLFSPLIVIVVVTVSHLFH